MISNRSQWCFRLQNLGIHLLSLAFCRWFYPLLPNLSYIFKEMLIMDYYLLSIFFKKLFHLLCLEIWLSRANDIILKLLKRSRARQGTCKVLVRCPPRGRGGFPGPRGNRNLHDRGSNGAHRNRRCSGEKASLPALPHEFPEDNICQFFFFFSLSKKIEIV